MDLYDTFPESLHNQPPPVFGAVAEDPYDPLRTLRHSDASGSTLERPGAAFPTGSFPEALSPSARHLSNSRTNSAVRVQSLPGHFAHLPDTLK